MGLNGSVGNRYDVAIVVPAVFLFGDLAAAQAIAAISTGRPVGRLVRGNLVTQAPLLIAEWSASVLLLITVEGMGSWSLVPVVALLLLIRQSYALLMSIRETYRTTVEVLVEAAEGQDRRLLGHAERTAEIARRIAARMGLTVARVELVSYAALLHDVDAIRDHAATVRAHLSLALDGADLTWWGQRGGVALGAWPLGYYRPIMGAGGKFLGWSGTRETFAGQLVGPYADKMCHYSAQEFRRQLAALRLYSDGFVWINGLGASWWQIPSEKADYYAAQVHRFARDNELAPTAAHIESYYQVTSRREVIEEAVP